MKLLVTGGAGFIGSHYIRYVLQNHPDDSVVNLDALTYAGNLENLRDVESDSRYSFVKGDICDRDTVFPLVEQCDAVVHFAAESHVDRSILDPSGFVRTNVLGTQVLLDAARKYGTRFHHVSTDEVYGALGPNDPPFHEKLPYSPRSPYSASKAASDHLVLAYGHTYNLPVTISNCSNNYGSFQFPEKLIPLAISNIMEDKKVPVYGDGLQVRDWIYVVDHVRGVDLVLRNGKVGETYCLGGQAEVPNIEIVKMLLVLLGRGELLVEYVKDRPGHDRRYAMNIAKAQRELGFAPSVTLEQGLKETVQWYQENSEWVSRCKSGEYQLYYQKQYSV
jgi:dTDP-glucose 4,6-dehydratase